MPAEGASEALWADLRASARWVPVRSEKIKIGRRMRPDRIVVGEVRGAEAFELSRAVNAGCGFLCTVHANSASEALDALVNAALMAGENVTERIVRKVFSESLDVVIHVDRDDIVTGDAESLRRQVMEIAAVVPALRDDFTIEPLFVARRGGLAAALDRRAAVSPRGSAWRRCCRRARCTPSCPAPSVDRESRGRALHRGLLLLRGRVPARPAAAHPRLAPPGARGRRAAALAHAGRRRRHPAAVLGGIGRGRSGRARRRHARHRHRARRRRARGRGGVAPTRVLRPTPGDSTARGAGGMARRPPRSRVVDRRRSVAERRARRARGHGTGPAACRVRPLRVARADARHRSRARSDP